MDRLTKRDFKGRVVLKDSNGWDAVEKLAAYEDTGLEPERVAAAIEALKEKIEREKNEPLTFDELRRMRGKPVWVQPPDMPEYGRWAIVRGAGEFNGDKMLFIENDFTCREYGRVWLAYRHELKEGNDAELYDND